jgi:signal transduction histidine kinase
MPPLTLPVAPFRALLLVTLVAALLTVGALGLALQVPATGVTLAPAAEGLEVVAVSSHAPAAESLGPGDRLLAIGYDGERLPLTASLAIEEPDQLGGWPVYNAFLTAQDEVAAAIQSGSAAWVLPSGTAVPIVPIERRLGDLPGAFWLQVGAGWLGFLLAAGVWAFRQRDPAAGYFALAGFGMLVFTHAAAVYSTRELAMMGERLWALSMTNHLGAFLFTAALVALLWNYPQRLARFPVGGLVFLLAGVAWLANVLQWTPGVSFSYTLTLALFAPSFVLAALQWRTTRGHPVERAALKWFLLSIYLGTGLFAAVILLPSALGIVPLASQGGMFAVFLFMFAGIALGILRYRLFDLDRWWFAAWSWFFGGLAVILVDWGLITFLGLSQTGALTVSLAVIGWLYFPLRQWAWRRLYGGAEDRRERLAERIQSLFSASREDELQEAWYRVLRAEFAPLMLEPLRAGPAGPLLDRHGEHLTLPALGEAGGIRLAYPQRGHRLFNRDDLTLAGFLVRAAERALEALRAREEAIRTERARITRDLHDDLGAKLVSLVHLSMGGEPERLARHALQDMRDILSALEAQPCPLDEALAEWRLEVETRTEGAGVRLEWQSDALPPLGLTARERTNLGRILREALTNALKHASLERLWVGFAWCPPDLTLKVSDDGGGDPAKWRAGRGTRVIRTRAADLGGEVRWQRSRAGGVTLEVQVVLEEGRFMAQHPREAAEQVKTAHPGDGAPAGPSARPAVAVGDAPDEIL